MWLIYTSRKTNKPLHIISMDSSGTGKSHLLPALSALVPFGSSLSMSFGLLDLTVFKQQFTSVVLFIRSNVSYTWHLYNENILSSELHTVSLSIEYVRIGNLWKHTRLTECISDLVNSKSNSFMSRSKKDSLRQDSIKSTPNHCRKIHTLNISLSRYGYTYNAIRV